MLGISEQECSELRMEKIMGLIFGGILEWLGIVFQILFLSFVIGFGFSEGMRLSGRLDAD